MGCTFNLDKPLKGSDMIINYSDLVLSTNQKLLISGQPISAEEATAIWALSLKSAHISVFLSFPLSEQHVPKEFPSRPLFFWLASSDWYIFVFSTGTVGVPPPCGGILSKPFKWVV
jgi:hypothetical protein